MATFTESPHYKFLTYEVRDRVAIITLNRPEKRNALNFDLVHELKRVLGEAEKDQNAKVILLKANGKAFCAGADLEYLKQLQKFSFDDNLKDSNHLMELFLMIYKHPKVVVAQIEGHAIAGGAGLATVCDFAYSVPRAKFGYTEVRIGFIPAIVMFFLIRKLGDTRAKELLLSGALIEAKKAADYGMINEVYEAEEIEEKVWEFVQTLCTQNSGQSMAMTKRMIADLPKLGLEEGLKFASKMNAHARATEDCQKGISAFLNKEELKW